MQAIPYIMMAVGTAMQAKASREQADDRRKILNRQLEREDDATGKAIEMVQQEGQRFDPQSRMDGLQQSEQQAYDQSQADIAGAGGAGFTTAGGSGAISSDFLQTKAARAVEEGNRLTSVARAAAKSRAPGMLNMEDGLSLSGMTGNMANLWSRTGNMGRAAGLDAEGVEPPAYGAVGGVMSSVGSAMAGGGGGGFGQVASAAGNSMQAGGMKPGGGQGLRPPSGVNWGAR
jgi:hypothetical protein